MATFTYEAMNSVGQPVKGEVDATSSEEAIQKVRAMGNFPTKIKEKAGKKSKSSAPAAGKQQARSPSRRKVGKVSRKLLTQFTRQLSTLVDAGLPLLRSLRILKEQQKPGMLRVAIRMIEEDVEGGSTLSEAMGRHPKAFDRLYVNMVHAGEVGGVLDMILRNLADFMEKAEQLRRKVISAMIYPAAVITFAVLILTMLLIVVVPKFKEIFADMHLELPGITQALLGLSNWVGQEYGWVVILLVPGVLMMTFRLLKMSTGGRYFVDKLKMSIPILGRVVSKSAVARFSRTFGVLLSAGVPILEALNITRDTSGNEVYGRALQQVHDGIREGESIGAPLRQARVVDPMVVNMIDVGEETGELDKMLTKVADTYDDEVSTLVASMVSLLEPVMVITLGVIVGFIVIALFYPMISMIQNLSKPS